MRQRLDISNRDARRLWLWANGLAPRPTGPLDVAAMIDALGLLQIDTIRNVTRAQDHILWTRNQSYREGMLWPLLQQRRLFEHFTHDASLLPAALLPDWSVQFRRLGARAARAPWYQSGLGQAEIARIRDRIAAEGPLSTHAFDTRAQSREMWARPPHKKALEQMWYAGTLATSHRRNFVKFYDLGTRVFPDHDAPPESHALTRLHRAALERLCIATPGEVQRFWSVATAAEIRDWAAVARTVPVRVQGADGSWRDALAHPEIESRLADAPAATTRLRILNPFDPAIRDRARLERLFGFVYRNEIFVPAARRQWVYYVYPLLQGDRFVGRIELRADRAESRLRVTGFWPEAGVSWRARRAEKLDAELARFARMVDLTEIEWSTARP